MRRIRSYCWARFVKRLLEPRGPSMLIGGFAFVSWARYSMACVVGPFRARSTSVMSLLETSAIVKGLKRRSWIEGADTDGGRLSSGSER